MPRCGLLASVVWGMVWCLGGTERVGGWLILDASQPIVMSYWRPQQTDTTEKMVYVGKYILQICNFWLTAILLYKTFVFVTGFTIQQDVRSKKSLQSYRQFVEGIYKQTDFQKQHRAEVNNEHRKW